MSHVHVYVVYMFTYACITMHLLFTNVFTHFVYICMTYMCMCIYVCICCISVLNEVREDGGTDAQEVLVISYINLMNVCKDIVHKMRAGFEYIESIKYRT